MVEVRIALLGEFELRVDGHLRPVPSTRQRALLATLALSAGRVVPTGTLSELVWGDAPPEHPRANVHTLINRVRARIGVDTVGTTPGGYRLDLPADAVDALRFQRLAAAAAGRPADEARATLTTAIRLWRGDPLVDAGSDTLLRERAPALVEQYLGVVERLAGLRLDAGDHGRDLVAELTDLTRRYPLRESLWTCLVTALAAAGRPADALAAYHEIRQRLADEFGSDPSPALRRAYADVLAEDSPAPAQVRAVPRQLPPETHRFVGRDDDLAALDAALDRTGGLIVLHGPGGVGKTSLALRWAHRIADRFPDGQLHLDLGGFGPAEPLDPAAALDTVLRGLGVPAAEVPREAAERSALLRTLLAGRRVLLVLDNARDAGQVRPLLAGGTSLVLVTSRNQLRGLAVRDGARHRPVRGMSAAESATLVATVVGADRARAEPAAVADLAELCGRLPLALVVAAEQAVRFPDTPLAGLVAMLRTGSTRLDHLAEPYDEDIDPRTVFSWSYRRLAAPAARAFRLLSLHPGGDVTTAVAAALLGTGPGPARALLDVLVSMSLVDNDRPDRYHTHDLLAAYAAELCAAEEPAADRHAAERRMHDWYLHTLWHARAAVFSAPPAAPDPPAEAIRPGTFDGVDDATSWYRETRRTLVAVVESTAGGGYDRHCWQLAYLLRPFQGMAHDIDDQLRTTELAVTAVERSGDDRARASIWHERGNALNHATPALGDDWLRRALALAEHNGDHHAVSSVLSSIGVQLTNRGRADSAIPYLERSVAAARRSPRPLRLAHSLLNLANAEGTAGPLDSAAEHNTEALAIYRRHGAPYQQSLALANLAENAVDRADPHTAIRYADESLALLGDIDDATGVAGALIAKGRALLMTGDHAPARHVLRRALTILERSDDPRVTQVRELLDTIR
ncbi:AfsR/SARP family transcriptional regulator [Actinocatenispora rupis]|uniref:SARP family transcriptional regulator n=1 Tax=Actinocatenispora rupis TaxID=519421 RepID=A0A8J3J9G1_9ACTN|nr:BTAD domain-containing putative transcriptional regulator [Actinocatenispora rupis]GID10683.1 SARP family transcriptional regulator [Actinocatenispora rupis]